MYFLLVYFAFCPIVFRAVLPPVRECRHVHLLCCATSTTSLIRQLPVCDFAAIWSTHHTHQTPIGDHQSDYSSPAFAVLLCLIV